MSDWFEWKGENFYAVRGEDLYHCGAAAKRAGEDKWDAYANGQRVGVFVTELSARFAVEVYVRGRGALPPGSMLLRRGPGEAAAKPGVKKWRNFT